MRHAIRYRGFFEASQESYGFILMMLRAFPRAALRQQQLQAAFAGARCFDDATMPCARTTLLGACCRAFPPALRVTGMTPHMAGREDDGSAARRAKRPRRRHTAINE